MILNLTDGHLVLGCLSKQQRLEPTLVILFPCVFPGSCIHMFSKLLRRYWGSRYMAWFGRTKPKKLSLLDVMPIQLLALYKRLWVLKARRLNKPHLGREIRYINLKNSIVYAFLSCFPKSYHHPFSYDPNKATQSCIKGWCSIMWSSLNHFSRINIDIAEG